MSTYKGFTIPDLADNADIELAFKDYTVSGPIPRFGSESAANSGGANHANPGALFFDTNPDILKVLRSGGWHRIYDYDNFPHATTSVYGTTKLTTSVSSTSTTLAATASAVKSAKDTANAALPKAGGTITGSLTINNDLIVNDDVVLKNGTDDDVALRGASMAANRGLYFTANEFNFADGGVRRISMNGDTVATGTGRSSFEIVGGNAVPMALSRPGGLPGDPIYIRFINGGTERQLTWNDIVAIT